MTLVDSFDRHVTYLRVSLTDRCNYRCLYCMPEEGVAFGAKSDVLSFEEIERLVRCFAKLGISRVRLTGGEPTVRRDLVELVRRLAAVQGINEICLTTNGHLLADLAVPLRAAGLDSINTSLDSLRADRFVAITRQGDLAAVLCGIEAARAAGFTKLKINVVGMRGYNDDELADLAQFAWKRAMVPRFIEWMPMAEGSIFDASVFLSASEMREAIAKRHGGNWRAESQAALGAGPARYFELVPKGFQAGFISALTENFCQSCNRVRLTSTGELHSCLARDDAVSLRSLLRLGASDEDVTRAILQTVAAKQLGHEFTTLGCGGPRKQMVAIGG